MAVHPEHNAQQRGCDAKGKVEVFGGARTYLDNQRLLAIAAVVVAVSVVVDDEQSVNDQSTGYRGDEYLPSQGV